MSLLLKQIFQFFRLLNSDTGTNSLALGLACGLILGFSPFLSLQTLLVLICCFFFRIQLGGAFISAFFFKFVAYLIDPISDPLGRAVLESQTLHPLFVTLYNIPFVPLTRFNNSVIMGSGLIGFLLAIPAFFFFRVGIIKYRDTVVARYRQSKIWKAWAATSFYKWYNKYEQLYG
jgi:uncharacterized protein (TIGR03546 family)